MNSGISSLYNVLKDKTRRQIVLLLHEKGSLSYVDLMKALGIENTGKMNYHLKVLGDLLVKTEDGTYTLTEKGKLASRLLLEFPERRMSQAMIDAEMPKWLITLGVFGSLVFIFGSFALYGIGVITLSSTLLNVTIYVSALIILFVSRKARKLRAQWSPKSQLEATRILFIVVGAIAGFPAFVFGEGFLLYGLQALLQSVGISLVLFPFVWWVLISVVVGPIVGGCLGYLYFKRSRYSNTAYYTPF
jgi:hypothetical protein